LINKLQMNPSNFESAFIFYSDNPIVFQPINLNSINIENKDDLQSHNIYIITRSNRTWFSPENALLDIDAGVSKIDIAIQNGFRTILQEIHSSIPKDAHSIKFSPFPYKEVFILDRGSNILRVMNASKLAIALPDEIRPTFEVLYVGKSFGRKNQLNVSDRLYRQNHKKFKQILIDTQADHPDKEIFIFSFNYAHSKNNVLMNSKGPLELGEKEFRRFNYLKSLSIDRREKVSIIEEALINYFVPPYNELCRESLTKLSTKAIQYFQGLDISGLIVELSLNETGIKLSKSHSKIDSSDTIRYIRK